MHGRRDDGREGSASSARRETPSLVLVGRSLQAGRIQPVEVGVSESGWIVRVGRNVRAPRRRELGERVILPAATDLHVHFRDPGGPEVAESFPTGTVGAALGGVTLVGEMPNTQPIVTDRTSLLDKSRRAQGRLAVDVLLYGAARAPAQVQELAGRAGAFKLYLSSTNGIDGEDAPVDLGPLLRAIA